MANQANHYDAGNIQVLEGLEAVRMRPGMYIGTTSTRGLHHLLWEIVDNAIDEASNGFADEVRVTLHTDGSASVYDNGRGMPVDEHPTMHVSGAEVIFTTTPQLVAPSLKVSIRYPKVRFLNCSIHMPYSTVRTYYSRIYEGKFITGAIAGAMADNNRIGYVGSYPIFGVPASINAFALGAQLTNPRAQIELKWSCMPGNPTQEFIRDGIRVISNRDTPAEDKLHTEYGTYYIDGSGEFIPLGSPCWIWGKFYENVIRAILSGTWDDIHGQAVNDWWGMSSGVIDVKLADDLPEGIKNLALYLRSGIKNGTIDPFRRKIVAQGGVVKNDGIRTLGAEDLLHMDWLCENVHGAIPAYDELLPISKPTVRLLGLYRDTIPADDVT